ncbi:MAG TPA: methionyl-tRNA formyltransferase [Terriglobia bacterium]|nr:methionyl-tRNA formyltransferase [Terriglobia bacterium]
MKFGWIGFHVEGLPALRAAVRAGYRLEAVVTLDQNAAAKRSGAAAYDKVCEALGVPLYTVSDINAPSSIALLERLDFDVTFVIGWTQLLKSEALRTAKFGMVGAHASLLPRLRGRAPINWALIRGETQTGNTLMWLADGVDTGEIIDQTTIPISPYDTCNTLYEAVAESNKTMICRLMQNLTEGRRPGRPQPVTDEQLLCGRKPSDGLIDWQLDSWRIYNFVRALTRPYPGAFAFLDEKQILIWRCASLPAAAYPGKLPGQIIGPMYSAAESACGQVVACREGAVALLEVELDGHCLKGRDLSDMPWAGRRFRT